MSKVVTLNTVKDPLDEASLWVAKLDRGLDNDEQTALKNWLAQSPQHVDTFMKMVTLWDKMSVLSQLGEIFPQKTQRAKRLPALAIAASLLIVSLVSAGMLVSEYHWFGKPAAQIVHFDNQYETKIGEQSSFYLQDNTQVVLNTNSLVKVTYTDKQRLFELVKGEMHVTVAHNEERPLSVYAAGKVIQAVGTAFNVQLDNQGVELIVTDGKVLVADADALPAKPLALENVHLSSASFAVVKGQKAHLQSTSKALVNSQKGFMESELAWQQGNLIFRGETLEEAMQEVSRYSTYRFDFAHEDVKGIQIAGRFKTSNITSLLTSLERNFDITYEKLSHDHIRLSKKLVTGTPSS